MSGSDPGSLASDTSERLQDACHRSDLGSIDSDISELLEDDLPLLPVANTACASETNGGDVAATPYYSPIYLGSRGTNGGDIATAACAVRKREE